MSPTEAYRALSEGRHDDPFSILGCHKDDDNKYHVTVFMPGADSVEILTGAKTSTPMDRHPDFGEIFTTSMARKPNYRLRVHHGDHAWETEDPYCFDPVFGEVDEYLLSEGTHRRIWQVLGAHLTSVDSVQGVHFAVWAPDAQRVSVVGDFNAWDGRRHVMRRRGVTGVWEIFIPNLTEGDVYKYELRTKSGDILPQKADPVGFGAEHPPATGSVVRDISDYKWGDKKWMKDRKIFQQRDQPISVYEVNLGSWKRKVDDGNRRLSYIELAEELVTYVKDMGFTHIELMPISEYPFDGSWGYQPVGMFAPTIRFGTPNEFRAMVDAAHQAGLGVLLDWVPGHFPTDAHGLGQFDGTALYEHADPREGFHQDWNTLIYNFGRNEVRNYLTSNALYWLEEYHIDGLRVDAVASMLYRDYSRKDGEWIPNKDGGNENYEAIALLQEMNTIAYGEVDGIITVAEESTSFPKVSQPVDAGGLGFGYKWNLGWMNDTLRYMALDPIHRQFHHHDMTFGLHYAFTENFMLPISHDEVVHGKGSMIEKMSGNRDEKFANLRAYYGFMWGHPGKKLLFMGTEFGQDCEWNHEISLDWHLLDDPKHAGVQSVVRDLNGIYKNHPELHQTDALPEGFEWLEIDDRSNSIYAFIRRDMDGNPLVVASNFTPIERVDYRIGFPKSGEWTEIFNSDAGAYAGENRGNFGVIKTDAQHWHNQDHSAALYLPPLSTMIFKPK